MTVLDSMCHASLFATHTPVVRACMRLWLQRGVSIFARPVCSMRTLMWSVYIRKGSSGLWMEVGKLASENVSSSAF